jgi:hypothetical protein
MCRAINADGNVAPYYSDMCGGRSAALGGQRVTSLFDEVMVSHARPM